MPTGSRRNSVCLVRTWLTTGWTPHFFGRWEKTESWTTFCQILRKLDPNFIVDRGAEDGPEVTGMQDEGWFGPEGWVIFLRRQHERGAASPPAHELGGNEFLFLRVLAVLA